ncbi:MAG: hypothetical protein AB8G16_14225 [Gammaproteobacteria bacterium]
MNTAQRGAALTEFVVVMIFFVPVIVGMPLIAKYSDIKSKTIEASRYAAWERTVWSDRSAQRNDGRREIFKSQDQINKEIDHRFFGNPVQGLHDLTPSINYYYRNRHGEFMLRGDVTEAPPTTPRRSLLTLKHENPTDRLPSAARYAARQVDKIAFAMDPSDSHLAGVLGAQNSSVFGEASNSELIGHISGGNLQCNPTGIDINDGLDLGARGFASAEVTMLANDYMHGDQPVRYAFTASSAVLGNAWSAPDESLFAKRVDNMSIGDMAGCITLLGKGIGTLTSLGGGRFLFGEGMQSNPVEDFNSSSSATSRTLPRYMER